MLNKSLDETLVELCKFFFSHITAKTAIDNSDLLLCGKFVVGREFHNIEFDTTNINWRKLLEVLPEGHAIDAHMLTPVFLLSYAYSSSNELEYIKLAFSMLRTWAYFEQSSPARWFSAEHRIMASRTVVLVYFAMVQESTNLNAGEWISQLVRFHCNWIIRNYKQKHNDGILMDLGLIIAGKYLGDTDFTEQGCIGLCAQLSYIYPHKAAHRGSSTRYNIDMLWRFFTPFYCLQKLNLPEQYIQQISECISGAIDFVTDMVMPTSEILTVGDSHAAFFRASKGAIRECSKFGHMKLAYALSQGRQGEMPQETRKETAKIYHKDGYAFFRSTWDSEDYENATWICFKAGYSSLVHKHKDDLALCFVTKGVNVFIDPGMGTKGDLAHEYLQSAFAHCGVIVDNSSYTLEKNMSHKVGLFGSRFKQQSNLTIAGGYNNMYEGVYIDRTIMYVHEHEFYIIDDIYSETEHKYAQNYHLSNEVEVIACAPGFASIKLTDSEWNVCIVQHEPADGSVTCSGKTNEISTMSLQGISRDKYIDTTSLRFEKSGKNVRFITAVRVVHDNEIKDISGDIAINGNCLSINGDEFDISPRKRVMPVDVDMVQENGKLLLTPAEEGDYAFRLLAKDTQQVVAKTRYSKKATASMEIPCDGLYVLCVYRRAADGEVIKWIAGDVRFNC